MSFAEVEMFYGQLAKKNAIGEALGKRIRSISSEQELQKLIQEDMLPLARKMGYDFSEKDLFEYEKVVAQRLSPEDLLNVSGGISLKSALLSGGIFSLAMLGFGSIAPMQADAMVPKAVVESVTGDVVVDAKKEIKIREEAAQREQIQNAKNELANKLENNFLRSSENTKFITNVAYFKRNISEIFRYGQWGWLSLNQAGFEINKPTVSPETSPVFQYLINIYKDFYPSTINCSNITWDDYCNICNILIAFFNNNEIKMASSLLDECSTYGITFNEISENSIRDAINTLRGEGAPAAGLAADKELVIPDTEMLVEEAKDEREIELSQTDYGYILDAWNGAEALVYKLTGLTENFRFLNPANHPTLEKKDGEKYFRWKYNEDSGDGFGELMRILFPCSDGQRIATDGGAPNVPAFSRDCKPTVKLMAQIAAMLYKYRTASDDEKAQIKQDIESLLGKISAISDDLLRDKTRNELNSKFKKSTPDQAEQNRQNIKTYETLMKEYDDLFAQVCTLFDRHKDIKAYNISPSEVKKFNAMNIIKNINEKNLAREAEKKKQQQALIEKLKKWFDVATQLAANQDVKQFKKYENFTALKNKMEPFLLQSIATDSKKVLNDDTLFASGSFCDNVIHANTMLRLLTSAFYAIDNQEYDGEDYNDANPDKFAPKYFVEKMLMNFCVEHFNTADDLNDFYNEAKSLIKHVPTTASLTQAKESGERVENTLKLLKKLEVSPLSPYTLGTAQNGDTYKIGPVENGNVTFINDTFADCADIAVCHVVNLLGYSVNKNWNVFFGGLLGEDGSFKEEEKAKLEARFKAFESAAKGHTQFEFLPLKDRLQLFFYHQSKVGVDATDKITRTLWEYAICNMNDRANLEDGMYKIRYVKGNYELDTGLINSLKLVYNISKALGLGTDKLTEAKTAIDEFEEAFEEAKKGAPKGTKEETISSLNTALENAATDTYQLINQAASVTSDVLSFKRKDVFGSIDVSIKYSLDKDTEMCTFGITQSPEHGYVTHDPKKPLAFTQDELKSEVDRLLAKANNKNNDDDWGDDGLTQNNGIDLNKFHMLFGNFVLIEVDYNRNVIISSFKSTDPQYYKDFQALRFLKVAQGEEENEYRLCTELQQNPFVKDANIKVNLRDVQKMGVPDNKEEPLAVVVFDTYCPYKDLFLGVSREEFAKEEIDFLHKHNRIDEVLNENNFTYIIRGSEATLALYEGESSNVTIPSEINGYTVTKIGENCFCGRDISTVTIPSAVKEIGTGAFYGCEDLISIKFDRESQLKTIGSFAFFNCVKLEEIIIPKSVERIKTYSFASCDKLSNISFEEREGLLEVEAEVFPAYPFSQIAFPSTAIFSTDSPLYKAKKLKTVKFTGNGEIRKENILKLLPGNGAEKFFAHNIEKLFDGKDSIQVDGELEIDLWGDCLREDGTLDLRQFDVNTFKTFKFAENEVVKKVIWPQGIDEIPAEMFSECNSLEEITIPKTVTNIGEKAFYWCTQLKNVTFERDRTENLFIGEECFLNCGLNEVTITENVSLGDSVFSGNELKKIIIETADEGVTCYSECFDCNLDEDLKIYVKNEAMKEKIEKDFEDYVKPENVIVGLPNENE